MVAKFTGKYRVTEEGAAETRPSGRVLRVFCHQDPPSLTVGSLHKILEPGCRACVKPKNSTRRTTNDHQETAADTLDHSQLRADCRWYCLRANAFPPGTID